MAFGLYRWRLQRLLQPNDERRLLQTRRGIRFNMKTIARKKKGLTLTSPLSLSLVFVAPLRRPSGHQRHQPRQDAGPRKRAADARRRPRPPPKSRRAGQGARGCGGHLRRCQGAQWASLREQ